MTTGTTETQRTFATLYREKLELDSRLNIVKHEIENLQESLLNYFADAGKPAKPVLAETPDTPIFDLLRDLLSSLSIEERNLPPAVKLFLPRIVALLESRPLILYVNSELWVNAKPGEQAQACAALIANGFADFVSPTFNVSTLSAEARGMANRKETFPDAVLEHLDLNTKVQIRGRRLP